jgi:hypothetical protein
MICGPYWAGAGTPSGASVLVSQPQPHFTVSIWCSVTSAFTGGMSMTWRRSVPVTSPRRRDFPQPPHRSGRCFTTLSGWSLSCIVAPSWPSGRPGFRPDFPRSDFGAGFARPSDDGGCPEGSLIAYHLAAESDPQRHPGQAFAPGMLDAGVLTAAFTLLTARPDRSGQDPLASLVTGIPPAVPSSWRPASPALVSRITRARDPWLRPADRLRHATTLPVPRVPDPRAPGTPDLAARAARLPDQFWPDWAVRLTDDPASSSHDKLLPAALIALPHPGP